MSEAPERIEIESECGHANTYNSEDRRTWLHFPDNPPDYFYGEYVRADRIEELEAKLAKAVEGFEKLARLGNEDRYGNSDGNVIAQSYIAELTGGKDE